MDNMWKVLLVEDEGFVRRKLRKLVDWEALGFTVTGEASNGLEALELMRQSKPDLVIADIMMPVMDGLELLRTAREEEMDSRFVMLTCMNEFEYARQALEYGASGYMLKLSMSISSLQGSLLKVRKELSERSEQRKVILSRVLDNYCFRLWERIRTEPESEGEASLPVGSSGLPAFKRVFIVTLITGAKPIIPAELLGLVAPKADAGIWSSSFTAEGLTTLFFWFENEPDLHFDRLFSLEGKGVYSVPFSPCYLPERWKWHLQQIHALWFSSRSGLFEVKSGTGTGKEPLTRGDFVLNWIAEKEVIAAFEQFRRTDLTASLTAYWKAMEEQQADFGQIRETAARLDRIFAGIAKATSSRASACPLDATVSHSELLDLLLQRAGWLLDTMAYARSRLTDHPEINRILQYLHQHYSENIALKTMAGMVAMEEHYLSRLFKQKAGQSFVNYIQMLRVEKAKLLLKQTELSICEIGLNTGFPSENYFVKTFKKWCGKTPGHYRKDALEEPPV